MKEIWAKVPNLTSKCPRLKKEKIIKNQRAFLRVIASFKIVLASTCFTS